VDQSKSVRVPLPTTYETCIARFLASWQPSIYETQKAFLDFLVTVHLRNTESVPWLLGNRSPTKHRSVPWLLGRSRSTETAFL
ncbi:9970_t:CDS:1, partial [Funneliformis geosporum]